MPEELLGKPVDWNIVVAGAWNVAILTPEGIATRLFELEPNTPIEVQVAVDVRAPIRVKYEDILIQPSPTSLVITPQDPTPEQLEKSVIIAKRALENLPETPFSAVGLNLRFLFEEIPDSLIEAGKSVIDEKLPDAGLEIREKMLKRKIVWQDGELNLDIVEREDSSALIVFNYHKSSNSPEGLIDWLGAHAEMLKNCTMIRESLMEE